jgi:hypothetical protein
VLYTRFREFYFRPEDWGHSRIPDIAGLDRGTVAGTETVKKCLCVVVRHSTRLGMVDPK